MTERRPIDVELFSCCDAEQRDAQKIKELLAQGANPNIVHWGGRFNNHQTPLMALVQHRDPDPEIELVSLLLSHGADPNLANPDGETALHSVAGYNFSSLVSLLLEHGANPNLIHRGMYYGSPMHRALNYHRDNALVCCESLLKKGADPNIRNMGETVLRKAIVEGAWKVVELLLLHGATPDQDIAEGYFDGDGSIQAALRAKADDEKLRWLVSKGGNPEHPNKYGNAALLFAAWESPERVPLLISLGCAVERPNTEGRTALLHLVARGGKLEGLRSLLQVKANPNAVDFDGKSAPWFAVDNQREDLLRALLAAGADPSIATKDGQRPVDLAQSRKLDLLAKILSPDIEVPRGSLLETILRAIESGRPFSSEKESIAFHFRSDDKEYFNHTHQQNPKHQKAQMVLRPWVKERLAWLALQRPQELCEYLSSLKETLGVSAPTPESLAALIEEQEPQEMKKARASIEGASLGQILAEGLWAGASFYSSNKEGYEEWRRQGEQIIHRGDGEGGPHERTFSLQEAAQEWSSWGTIVDGVVFAGYSSFSDALDKALKALGYDSLRAYLQASRLLN